MVDVGGYRLQAARGVDVGGVVGFRQQSPALGRTRGTSKRCGIVLTAKSSITSSKTTRTIETRVEVDELGR